MGGLSNTQEKNWKYWLLGLLGVLLLLLVVRLVSSVHVGSKGTGESGTIASPSVASSSTASIAETLSSETGETAETKEETEAETGLSAEIIEQLKQKQKQEGITPEDNAKAWEAGVKESIQATQGAGESTTAISDSTQAETGQETQSGASGDLSNGRSFTVKDPKRATINSDGELERSVSDKVKDAMLDGSGPTIVENSSDSMKIGYIIKDYYDTSDGRGAVGDTIMLGKIGIKVKPGLSEAGYLVSSTGDTAKFDFGDRGLAVITKVSDFDVTGLSLSQVKELGGIQDISEVDTELPTGGNYTSYSYMVVSADCGTSIKYYRCPFGTYQMYFSSGNSPIKSAQLLAMNVIPDESINSVASK